MRWQQGTFLHCLPAQRNRDTRTGEAVFKTYGLGAMEVTDAVFESPASKVVSKPAHTAQAVLLATIQG